MSNVGTNNFVIELKDGEEKTNTGEETNCHSPHETKDIKGGHDGSFQTRMEIAVLAQRGATPSQIAKTLDITWDMAKRWSDRSEEVMRTGTVQSNRKGKVGPKPKFATPTAKKKLYKKLKRTTQTKLAKDLGIDRHVFKSNLQTVKCVMFETIRRTICRSGGNPGGAFPYRKQKTPQFDNRIQTQRVAYAMWSPIGLAARDGSFDEEKKGWIFWDHTPTSKTGAINRSHDPAWLTKEDRDAEGVPSAGSSKFSIKVSSHTQFFDFFLLA